MIAAIMQPYFFPYIGYFQLMSAVDVFVFFDDAQYVTRGWVNRNLIYTNNAPHWLTMPVEKANRFLPINKRRVAVKWTLTGFALLTVGYFGTKIVLELILEKV